MHSFILSELNLITVFFAASAYFCLGALWYSPVLFGNDWVSLQGHSYEHFEIRQSENRLIQALTLLSIFIVTLLMAFLVILTDSSTLFTGIFLGLFTGIGFVTTTSLINTLYADRPIKLFAINAGYHILGFVLLGGILSIWR